MVCRGRASLVRRASLLEALLLLGLFVAALALRIPLTPLLDFSSDATDPIIAALRMMESWNPIQGDSARFGYGRALSYVPLALGVDDGLDDFVWRRAFLQSLIVPVTYLTVRMLLVGGLGRHRTVRDTVSSVAFATAAAGFLVVDQDLLQNFLWGHHGYLGPEWASLAVLGFGGLLVGEKPGPWASLLGISLGMCVMNHPYAVALTPLLGVAYLSARRDADMRRLRAALLAAVITLLMLAPHAVYLLDAPGGRADILESLVSPALLSGSRFVEVVSGLFSNILPTSALVLLLSLLLCLLAGSPRLTPSGSASLFLGRLLSRFGLAGLLSLGFFLLLGMASRQVHNWHWRMLLPLGAVCFALALAWLGQRLQARESVGVSHWLLSCLPLGLLAALFCSSLVSGYQAFREPAEQPRESLLQLGHIERIYRLLEQERVDAPWTVVTLGSPPDESYARLLPLGLQRALSRHSKVSFATHQDQWLTGPSLYYVEGSEAWIAAMAAQLNQQRVEPAWLGESSLAWRVNSQSDAQVAEDTICRASVGRVVRGDGPRDLNALLEMVGLRESVGQPEELGRLPSCLSLAY